MDLSFLFNLANNAYNTVGAVFFWVIVLVIILFSVYQVCRIIYLPLQNSIGTISNCNSSVYRFFLKPGTALAYISFGLVIWFINSLIFLTDGFILLLHLNSWILGFLIVALFSKLLPTWALNIIALGLCWYHFGFQVFLLLSLFHFVSPLISSMLIFQSSSQVLKNQVEYFGYPREIFLTGALSFQILAIPFYLFLKDWHWGWFVADFLGSTLLILHLVHAIKYVSKKKIIEEHGLDFTKSLYKTLPSYHLILFIFSWIVYNTYLNIETLKGNDFLCSIAVPAWLNVIALIGLVISIVKILKNKFASSATN